MKITEYLSENIIYLDGGMGTLLQAEGLSAGEFPERWNISHPDVIKRIHRNYFLAGSNVVSTNTFGANILKFSIDELDKVIGAAVSLAREAEKESGVEHKTWVALDIGPTGKLLKPYGDLDFEDAVEIFARTVRLGVKYGVDLIFIETMNDSYETKAALLAAKENSDLPVFVSNAYGSDGKLMTGADPAAMVALLEGMGADAIGANCSQGPDALAPVIEEYLKYSSVPVLLKPNAGLPRMVEGKTVFDVVEDNFAKEIVALVKKGVRAVGGCCGTTPQYIEKTVFATKNIVPVPIEKKNYTCVSSYARTVFFGEAPVLIGERINPTGKKRFKEALRENDIDYILKEGISQEEKGVHVLDVNVGLPEIDERNMLVRAVSELQAVSALPLQIDTADPVCMEAALRRYNGKAMINSVNGKKESMDAIFPLVKKYGGVVVALTLDERGIPESAEERVEIAKKILLEAKKYGIDNKNIIFDTLAMTVSADKNAAKSTLKALDIIKKELGCHTSLGVSNVSFGLPSRDLINGAFFTLALGNGLSAAIMNPYSAEMMKAYHSYLVLAGLDDNCARYIEFSKTAETLTTVEKGTDEVKNYSSELQRAIVKGLSGEAAESTKGLLASREPLDIIENEIIPALNIVGEGYEKKTVYLPSLLMSAEAAGSAFEVIKSSVKTGESTKKCTIVLATVKGDIHDIGKNIVKLMLENYGFAVSDLGRDVPPHDILNEAKRLGARVVALSALMTTTVPAMEETVKLIHKELTGCRVMVGGAVLTQEYADNIGADKYAKDAMEAVRYAEHVFEEMKND